MFVASISKASEPRKGKRLELDSLAVKLNLLVSAVNTRSLPFTKPVTLQSFRSVASFVGAMKYLLTAL